MKRLRVLFVVLFPVFGLLLLFQAVRLQAGLFLYSQEGVAFTVNSTVDATDVNPGDGVCETAVGNGLCSLRAAIQETNALAGSDVINLPSGIYTITIPGDDLVSAVGDLDITDSVEILGEGTANTVIDGNDIDKIFDIHMTADKEVTIANLTIMNGGGTGGVCHCTVDTKLYLTNVIIRENESFANGGGIFNVGYLEVISSTIQENRAGYYGGGISNSGTALVHATRIISNTAPYDGLGGGIGNGGVMTVTNTTIQGNTVSAITMGSNGGGVFNSSASAEIRIENSTISRNSSVYGYGGFANYGGIARLVNVTVSENNGGGILHFNGGTTYITNTTIISHTHMSFNVSLRVADGNVIVGNSIIAGEEAANNCIGLVTSNGHNLESGNSCGLNNSGDITGTNPLVGLLQWNGGDTQTHALLADSPAIDAGDSLMCPATDQRGVPRPIGPLCDIGAYEYNVALVAVDDVVTTSQDVPTLIDVLANDIPGPNGEPMLESAGEPLNGTAVVSDTFILYTPDLDFTGIDSFTYTITDGIVIDTAVVTVTILPVNDQTFVYLPVILKPGD